MSRDLGFNTRELPLFPLAVVLLPGNMLPLHIFEERYKTMLRDCLAGDKAFGIVYHTERDAWPPSQGRIGTIAQLMAVAPLDEGRMNILTVGAHRYRILRYVNTLPYLKAQVELLEDEPEEQDPTPVMAEIRKLYDRANTALRELNEEQGLPEELPETAEEFSFVIAGTLQLELEVKQQLLELRSVSARLQRVRRYLNKVLEDYELRASVHARAKKNGHSHHAKDIVEQLGRLQED